MSPGARVIRTPDQRLRIFVSSTLKELAPERRAARTAVERLHLAPVMFELGARPHPPRELYRAYLSQCDVFVGIYWESYGWVAPEEEVSGLEDEYLLCPPDLPRLLYIKQPAPQREPRLTGLLDRIRSDDRASFKYFESAQELTALIEADLATLLAERFVQSRAWESGEEPPPTAAAATPAPASSLPVPLTELIGREDDVARLQRIIAGGSRLVTITGPGGIGKTRLAIAASTALAPGFRDGAAFVDLSAVHDAAAVPNTIAQTLGVRDTGDAPIADKLAIALRERNLLLVLDNFEQVLGAAPTLVGMLADAPGLCLLVTSRSLLRVSGEQSFEARPLAVAQATSLFVDRVHAVRPDFEITPANAAAVARICELLDGVPLALELAAARLRVLSPAELAERLDRRLPLLVGGARDLPARQQTLRSTIEWSTQLLGEPERRLLACLGVFEGGFTLEAAELLAADGDERAAATASPDTLGVLSVLVDDSLLRQHDSEGHPRFSMLATVREYAVEQLAAEGMLEPVREVHARYFLRLADRAQAELEGSRQREWLRRLADDDDNLRAAERHLLARRDWARAAHLAWSLFVYRWVAGLLGEVRERMAEVLDSGDDLDDRTRAIALYFTNAIGFWQDPHGTVAEGLAESARLFRREGDATGEALALISLALASLATPAADPAQIDDELESSLGLFRSSADSWGEAMTLVMLGRVALLGQRVDEALDRFEQSLAVARAQGDDLGVSIAQHHRGWARLLLGDLPGATADFADCLRISRRLGHDEGVAYALEGLVALAAVGGDVAHAGRLLGAARILRERTGLFNAPAFSFHQLYVDRLTASGAGPALEAAIAEGRTLALEDAVAEASEVAV